MKIQNEYNTLSFSGKKQEAVLSIANFFRRKSLSNEERTLEMMRGKFAGIDAKNRGVDECKEIIIRETLAGNFDYLKGFTEIIGKDMAKKAYSAIGK